MKTAKKHLFRITSILLCFVMLLVFMPQAILAEAGELLNGGETPGYAFSEEQAPEAYVLGEMTDDRTPNTKTFRMSDGSFVLADYSKAVHFEDEHGNWADYDNTLKYIEDDGFAGYENTASDVLTRFAEAVNDKGLISLRSGNYCIGMSLKDAVSGGKVETANTSEHPEGNDIDSATTLTKYSSGVTYKDIYENTDLQYILNGGNLKENIIVKERTGEYVYTFDLALEGLVAALAKDGSVLLNDVETGDPVFVIPAGYMYDAKGECSDNVYYSIEEKDGVLTLTVIADTEWMEDEERAFPVTIDPTIVKYQTQYTGGRIKDTFVAVGHAQGYGDYAWMNVGTRNGYENVSLIGIANAVGTNTGLLPIPKTAAVTSAYLNLRKIETNGNDLIVGAYQLTENWDASISTGIVPGCDTNVIDYISISSSVTAYTLDITKAMIAWYNDPNDMMRQYGLALKPVSGSGYVSFSTANNSNYNDAYPMFIVSYRDTKGLEGTWQFVSHGAGNAGTGSVNTFNGNLVFVHDDTATKGNILPIGISHVYNSFLANNEFTSSADILTADFSNMKIGKGWKLSVQETIKRITIDGQYWYVFNDADGTDLYFLPGTVNGVHLNEDGYPLYLTVTTGTYKYLLKDDYGNCKYFDSDGRLVKMDDAFGNVRDFVYTNGRLTSITCTPKNASSSTQLTFTYNSANALQTITNSADLSETVTFYYSTTYNGSISTSYSGYLRKIVSSKYGTCTYSYNSDGALLTTTDSDTSYKIQYDYVTTNGLTRVSSVTEKVGSTTGQKIGFEYGDKKTVVRTSGNDDVYNNDDDILTTYVMDTYGKAVCSFSSDITGKEVYGAAYAKYTDFNQGDKKNNKITVDSVKGNTVENLLLNHNCESTTSWSGGYSGSGYSSSASTADKLYGDKSFVMSSTNNSSGYYRRYQNVTIPESGTYTFSAYVKTANVSTANNGGAFIILDGSESERLTGTTNTNIQNGWQRISVTKTLSANTTVQVQLKLAAASGTAYFDCVQLEKGEVASDYNLIQNGGMSLSSGGWSSAPNANDSVRGAVMKVTGSATGYNYKSQSVALNIPKETTLMLSGWGKAYSTPTEKEDEINNRTFRVVANILYTDNTHEDQAADFNPYYDGWQYSAAVIQPKKDVTSITVYLSYDFNCNDAYFDDICLTIEPVQTYAYDDNGNLTNTKNENGDQSLLEYAANGVDVANFTDKLNVKYEYTYKSVGSVNTHEVESVMKKDSGGTTMQTLQYEYDSYGNTTKSTLSSPSVTGIVTSSASYIENGNFLSTVTDSLGGITSYGYDSAKLLKYVQNANGKRTGYLYDSRNRSTGVFDDADSDGALDSGEANVQYSYTNNRLTGITTGSTSYTLSYDSFGNMTQVKAGNNTLATYTYASGNGKLLRMTLGSGDYEDYIYDHLDRLISVKYNNTVTYTLTYDANGQIAKCVDSKANITHTYEYDSLGRLIRAWQTNSSGDKTLAVENLYDQYGRADKSTYVIGDKTLTYDVNYKADTNLVSSISMPTSSVASALVYTYDGLDRLTKKDISFATHNDLYEEYSYYGYTSGGVYHTTPLVSTLTLKKDSTTTATYSYTYDSLGNITQVKENNVLKLSYVYDSLNQLVRENNAYANKTWKYTYDKAGNITGKYVYAYTTGTLPSTYQDHISYGYSTGAWGDMLTSYNGTTISYDAIGNPANWRGMVGLDWNGRQVTDIDIDGVSEQIGFKYNADGIRTKKSYYDEDGNLTTHKYILDGSKIVKETVTGNSAYTLYYLYDAAGSIAGFEYNGTTYYFQKNLQGDIIRICNIAGNTVVEYTYDAWGKVLSVTGSLASTVGQANPFRYRGYYYDTETGFYYLQTRYYDPEIGRFLNADTSEIVPSAAIGLTDKNLFAYCDNNPLMRTDEDGEFWNFIVGAIVGAVVGGIAQIVSNVITGNDWSDGLATAVISGAASGVLAASGVGIVGSVVGNAIISASSNAVNQVVKNKGFKGFDIGDMLLDGAIGGIAGAVGGQGMGKVVNIRTLNKGLTKKIVSRSVQIVKQGAKYYISQTKSLYKEYLLKPIIKSGASAFGLICLKKAN